MDGPAMNGTTLAFAGLVLAGLLAGTSASALAAGPATAWTVKGTAARVSDGSGGVLAVECAGGTPRVRLCHPGVAGLRTGRTALYPGSIDLIIGWSLDPGNPRHHGWNAPWYRAEDDPACLVPHRQIEGRALRNIASQWSVFVRFEIGGPVAMHLSLAGSSGAVEKACRRGRKGREAPGCSPGRAGRPEGQAAQPEPGE